MAAEVRYRDRKEAVSPSRAHSSLDALLDRAAGMSRALLDAQQPHALLWLDGAGGPQQSTRWANSPDTASTVRQAPADTARHPCAAGPRPPPGGG